jgi:hypothetical protein
MNITRVRAKQTASSSLQEDYNNGGRGGATLPVHLPGEKTVYFIRKCNFIPAIFNRTGSWVCFFSWRWLSEWDERLNVRGFHRWWCWQHYKIYPSSFWRVDENSFQNSGLESMLGGHPSLRASNEVGVLQLLGMSVFGGLQDFGDGSLAAFCGGCSSVCLGELHMELPGVDLGFFGSVDVIPQPEGLSVMLLVEHKQVGDHVLHRRVVFVTLQGFHAGNPGRAVLLLGWEESHGRAGNVLLVDAA